MRKGSAYLESTRDGRAVYLDGEVIDSVADHPVFTALRSSMPPR